MLLREYLALLRAYLKPQWLRVLGLALLLFGGIGLQLLNPQVIRYFLDTAQAGGALQLLMLAATAFLVIVLVERLFEVATTYTSQTVAWTATNRLRSDLTRHVLGLDMAFHNAHTPGELLERVDGDVDRLANFFSQFLLQIITGALLTVGVLILLFREDWRLGLILAIFAVIYLIVHSKDQQLAVPYWRKERQASADVYGFVEERFAGVRDLQTNGAVPYTLWRVQQLLRPMFWQSLKAEVATDIGWSISHIVFDLGTVTVMGFGAYLYMQGSFSIGTVYLIISYLTMLAEPLHRIARQLEGLQQFRVSVERVKALTETRSKIGTTLPTQAPIALPDGPLAVTFEQVTFGYTDDRPALQAINFNLEPGLGLGLLGRTGSGKTTLSRLLFRLYEVSKGAICLDGIDLRRIEVNDLRRHVGLVTQDVQLFQASVRDNLTLFDESIPDTHILDSLRALGLDGWFNHLPDGLDTQLAAGGGGLSAGEAQLLALTRVFLKDPGLVILDEASSRLDPATERLLESAIDRLLANRTAIIIAHRLSTVRRADQILILDQGRIKEYGRYQDLIGQSDSIFAGLLQTGLEEVLA